MITQRAVLVGIVGFCLYLIAFVNVLPTFYVLTWLSVGILVSSLGIALLSLVGLSCEWHISETRTAESVEVEPLLPSEYDVVDGDETPSGISREPALSGPLMEVQLANAGTLNKIGVLLEVSLKSLSRDEIITRRFLMEALPSGASIESTLPLSRLPRGRYRMQGVRLMGSDVLGLFRMQKRIGAGDKSRAKAAAPKTTKAAKDNADNGLGRINTSPYNGQRQPQEDNPDAQLIIGPAMISLHDTAMKAETGAASGQMGVTRMSRRLGQSEELRGTRPYVAGDDLRRVHWRSTARHGHLVVKEFHQTAQDQCLVVWDGAAQTTWGEDTVTTTEFGLRLVASLCNAWSESNRPYTLLRLDGQPLKVTTAEPGSTPTQSLSHVIEALADANAERTMPLSQAITGLLGGLPASYEVFVVTASLAPDVPQCAMQWRARGARLHVALVDGAAFLSLDKANLWRRQTSYSRQADVARGRRAGKRRGTSDVPHQRWESHTQLAIAAGDVAVTPEAYRAQQQALQESGIDVITVAPAPDTPREFAPPIRQALRELLEQPAYANYAAR
ncbi:MAG: DUF58 domain-containing protein [Abitibacteriaceae bacterium]|nr:DUF58 domain-containing protein [Abditibacteriaceae bacterium]